MNKHLKVFFRLLILTFAISSCGSGGIKNNESSIEEKDYVTYVLDSLTFSHLSEVELLDYSEVSDELMLKDKLSGEVIIIDNDGEVVSKFNPHIEGPSYVGNSDHGWVFHGDDGLVCFSNYYFYHLKKDGEMITKHKYPVEVRGIWMLDYSPEMMLSYSNGDEDYFVPFITEPDGFPYNSQAFQDSVYMLYRIKLGEGIAEPIMKKRPESIYRTLGEYVDRGWPYLTQVDGSKTAVMYSVDSIIYLYDAHTDELLQEIVIPEQFRATFESVPFGKKDQPDRTRINTEIRSTGEHIILRVMDRIPESVRRTLQRQGGRWWESQAYKEASKKYTKINTLLFDLDGNYLGPLGNEAGFLNYDMESTSQGYYWAQRRYEDERDYKTFLKVAVKEAGE